ncbi:hypothetical protein Agub_g15933, partial [Astrephomene gubernaculifera]
LYPLSQKQALLMLLWNYLSRNIYGPVQRITMENFDSADALGSLAAGASSSSAYRCADLVPEDEQELLLCMDMRLTFADWTEALWRIVTDWADNEVPPADRLAAVLGLE